MGKKRHIFIGTVFILLSLLPGCGTKEREMITDYLVTTEATETTGVSIDDFPAPQLDGDAVWNDVYQVANTSIVVNLRTLSYDQKTLHVHNVVEADGDNESSLVSELFDGKYMEIDHFKSGEKYSEEVVLKCEELKGQYYNAPNDSSCAWFENDECSCHVYSGYDNGIPYNLLLAFDKGNHQRIIVYSPVNPGSVIGHDEYYDWYPYEYDTEGINGIPISDFRDNGEKLYNHSANSDEVLKETIRSFCEKKLHYSISKDDLCSGHLQNDGSYSMIELLFYQENDDRTPESNKAYVNGYSYEYDLLHDRNERLNNAYGAFFVCDDGILNVNLTISYEIVQTEENVLILPISGLKDALKTAVESDVDWTKVSGSQFEINQMELVYHDAMEKNGGSIYIFPSWKIPVFKNGYCVMELYINAANGKLIDVEYN